LIVDGRNFLDPETVRQAGFAYEGIGRPPAAVEPQPAPEPVELDTALAPSVAAARVR
jgi:hypothetical protein